MEEFGYGVLIQENLIDEVESLSRKIMYILSNQHILKHFNHNCDIQAMQC